MSALVVAHPGRAVAYGAEELKLAAHKYGFLALSISILIHFSIIGFYYLNAMFESDKPLPAGPHKGPIITYDPPPRIPGIYTPPPVSDPAIPRPRGRDGIPVAVAEQPNANETIPSQDDRRRLVDPGETDFPPGPVVEGPVIVVDDGPPPIFVPVEKEPVVVKAVPPVYPPLALRAGIEGNMYVKIWVDRQGKPRQAEVVKSNNDIFNEAAIEAAKQFVFTPAYMNNGPVSVWVAVPFTFKLSENQ
jgi:periplasmic protein TonB